MTLGKESLKPSQSRTGINILSIWSIEESRLGKLTTEEKASLHTLRYNTEASCHSSITCGLKSILHMPLALLVLLF